MKRPPTGYLATLVVAAGAPAAITLIVLAIQDGGADIGIGPALFKLPAWSVAVVVLFLPLTFLAARTDGLWAGRDNRALLALVVLSSQALATCAYAWLHTGQVTTLGVLFASALFSTSAVIRRT